MNTEVKQDRACVGPWMRDRLANPGAAGIYSDTSAASIYSDTGAAKRQVDNI